MENKFIKITDKGQWRDLLNKVLFKTFFHNLAWEEFLEEQFSWLKFEHYNYQNEALLSLARCKIGHKEKLVSHPFCEYGGPLPLAEKIDFRQFQENLFSEFKGLLKISFHPRLLNYFPDETRSDPVSSERVSYFVEGPFDLRKTARYEIEKARRQNIQTEKCQNEDDLRSFYTLHLKGAKKHKIPAYPFSFFQYFWLSPEAEIILAKFKNKVIAGSCFLFYDKFVHYFQNAADEKYKKLGVNYLILWEKLQNRGSLIFDFGGTRVGSPLQVFKKGWGGREHPIYELSNYKRTDLRRSKLRNIFGFLPLFLIKKLSPRLLKYKL